MEKMKLEIEELRERLSKTNDLFTQEKQTATKLAMAVSQMERDKNSSVNEIRKLEAIVVQLKVESGSFRNKSREAPLILGISLAITKIIADRLSNN